MSEVSTNRHYVIRTGSSDSTQVYTDPLCATVYGSDSLIRRFDAIQIIASFNDQEGDRRLSYQSK